MSEALNFDQTENIVLHYLAASEEAKSAREVQEALGINMVMITRALMSAKNRKPALVSLTNGRYMFIGSKASLDPLPNEYRELIGEVEYIETQEEVSVPEVQSEDQLEATSLGPVDQQVLELLSVKKKVPLSGIIRQFKLEEDEAGSILDDLESKDLLVKEHIDDFDEDCFSISSKGLDVVERAFEEPSSSNVYPISTSSKEDSTKSEKPIAAPQEAHMAGSQRKFKMPSFDNIPEENASSRGRPTGDRDYENLRVCMLGYIEENQPCAKSNISRTLARLLSNFGRQTIIEEVDALVDAGYVLMEISGKREVFSLTDAGESVVDHVRAGKAIGPIIQDESGAKVAPKAAAAAKAKPASKPAEKPAAPKAAAPKPAQPQQAVAAPEPAPVAQAQTRARVSAPVSSRVSDDSGLSGRIDELLGSVPGEAAYQLRYCVDQLLERINSLEKRNEYLKAMNKGLIDEI